jgi:hypothetical protein
MSKENVDLRAKYERLHSGLDEGAGKHRHFPIKLPNPSTCRRSKEAAPLPG